MASATMFSSARAPVRLQRVEFRVVRQRPTQQRRRATAASCRSVALASAAADTPLSLGLQDAAMRVRESQRPDRLFDDQYAAVILGESAAAAGAPSGGAADAVATRVLDAALVNAVGGSADMRQVVVIGHGCDTRPFRLDWPPSVRFFELGPWDAIAHAELALARAGAQRPAGGLLRRLPADVSGAAAAGGGWMPQLEGAGFMADRPSAWALQGLFLMPPAAVTALLSEVGAAATAESVIVGEAGAAGCADGTLREALALAGFTLVACEPLSDSAERLGRSGGDDAGAGGGGRGAASGAAAAGVEFEGRAVFMARKWRLSLKQEDVFRREVRSVEELGGEEGFSDAA